MYEGFSDQAKHAMKIASREMHRLNHMEIDVKHLLLALLRSDGAEFELIGKILQSRQIDRRQLWDWIDNRMERMPDMVTMGSPPMTAALKNVLELARNSAVQNECECVTTGHLLIGIRHVREDSASDILAGHGLTEKGMLQVLRDWAELEKITYAPFPELPAPGSFDHSIALVEKDLAGKNVADVLALVLAKVKEAFLAGTEITYVALCAREKKTRTA